MNNDTHMQHITTLPTAFIFHIPQVNIESHLCGVYNVIIITTLGNFDDCLHRNKHKHDAVAQEADTDAAAETGAAAAAATAAAAAAGTAAAAAVDSCRATKQILASDEYEFKSV